jgi:glycosyltransferase involved in cell wall biosynthesis
MRQQVGFEDDLLIVHTRSWEPRYGVDIALNGIRQAFQSAPNLRVFMLGGGSLEDQVKNFVLENGLSDRVHFRGYLPNEALATYYQAADVYLSASHVDGSSVALMESMACGCPALVSDIPANLEWVSHGEQGWVFKDGDSDDLAQKVLHIMNNKQGLAPYGKNARAKTEKYADWQKNFAKLLALYDRILK